MSDVGGKGCLGSSEISALLFTALNCNFVPLIFSQQTGLMSALSFDEGYVVEDLHVKVPKCVLKKLMHSSGKPLPLFSLSLLWWLHCPQEPSKITPTQTHRTDQMHFSNS
ncbi:hypothetical protein XENORESO_002368 [Xenotaenia resolanae]|uniref:Uncharacterized protein n=1 Tax=Xenotaenia resolanae TaxID=208358 RepID=A0ABV0VP65_9TELE